MPGERFGNHRDRRRHDAVLDRDGPTSKQRRADGLEEIFADARDVRRDKLPVIRAGDPEDSVVEVNRHALGHGNRANAACLSEIVANLPDGEAGLSLRSDSRRQTRGRQSIGLKSQLGRPHPVEHHAAEDEKWYGDADLHHRRYAMHANRVASATAGLLLQRVNQIGTAEANGWQQPEEHAHEQAQSRRDRDTGRVQIDLLRNRRAHIPANHGRNTEQHERGERACRKRQQYRFEEQMPHETSPARAERRANGQLALTVGAANQHHAGDVQAHDHEHRSRQAEHDADHASRLRTTGRTQRDVRLDCRRLEFIRCGIPPRQTRYRRRNEPVRPRDVHASVESAVDPHPVNSPVVAKIRIRPQTRVPLQGNEQQGTRRLKEVEVATKVVRRDPDHHMRDAIDRHGFADDVGIGGHPAPPEVIAQYDARLGRWRVVDRGIESRSARERNAKSAEVVGRHVQRRHTMGRRVVGSLLPGLAGIQGPPRDGHAGFGVAQRLIVRIGPLFERPLAGFGAKRTEREHQEFRQPARIDAARRRRDRASEGRERDQRSHADTERDDAYQREPPVLGERPCGMSQVAADRMERIQTARDARQSGALVLFIPIEGFPTEQRSHPREHPLNVANHRSVSP